MSAELYEKLGLFYLGRQLDRNQEPTGLLELIKNKNLTTHAAIIGMTGSGKTGLGIGLLEEAAIDKIPALIIDPKGDMGDLLLTFEDLDPKDFEPWIDPLEAQRKGKSVAEYAKDVATLWKKGIESFDQDVSRIKRLKESADFTIYTPGSSAGVPISLLADFKAPSHAIKEDLDSYTQLLSSTTSSLLSLIGHNEKDTKFVLLSNILDHFWQQDLSPTLEELIAAIINPPFKKIGILSVESILPQSERMKFALSFNNIISDPSFANWLQGEPLNISRLLFSEDGKPRHSIFYIAHLSDNERMFFVTRLLNELVSWMRTQSGTSALRALLYMDEIFGYFPPNANPPSKEPMLLLLKQARAYGLGVVLSTQNPVDLDYKGLANIGTWFLGRLQTKQDIERVIDGLLKSNQALDKKSVSSILSNLNKRVFLLRSIHKEELELFQTRWVLSYLKGPLSKEEISRLMENKKGSFSQEEVPKVKKQRVSGAKPPLSSKIEQIYDIYDPSAPTQLVPYLFFEADIHFYSASKNIDKTVHRCDELPVENEIDFEQLEESECKSFKTSAPSQAAYAAIAEELLEARSLAPFEKRYKELLYKNERLILYKVPKLRMMSRVEERLEDFRARVLEELHDRKERQIEKLQERYTTKLKRLHDKLERLQYRLQEEKEQARSKTTDTIISVGMALLDSFFGRKRIKRSTIAKAGSAISKAKRAYAEYDDIEQIENEIEDVKNEILTLQEELEEKVDAIETQYDISNYEIVEVPIKPKKSDIEVSSKLLWRQI